LERLTMDDRSASRAAAETPVAAYKKILRAVLDQRPSGMRQRLAEALEKNRSFISQISNPIYPTPIPAQHVDTILEICHFSKEQRAAFLAAYERAHPRRARHLHEAHRWRVVTLRVPDLGDADRNQQLDRFLHDIVGRLGRLLDGGKGET
jgi:hypothetical protein